jgi:lipoprotein-releasing system permease protein
MNISFYIARRYLFAKKSRNIINIISMISMTVVAFVAAAMITVMSAFNGIEDLVKELFSNFDAPLTIVPAVGKSFADSLFTDAQLGQIQGIKGWSRVIEEDAWLQYADYNSVATVKGVSTTYASLSSLDSMMYMGSFRLREDSLNYAVLGLGLYSELRMPRPDVTPPIITMNAPIRGRKLSRFKENAFNRVPVMTSGAFSVNAELDVKYAIVSLDFARSLFNMEENVSSIEIFLNDEKDEEAVKAALQEVLPADLKVETRFDRNALVYKTNASEKWFTFLILFFVLLIACFNIIASLTMLIIEKKKDIYILESMGATRSMIRRVFVLEGIFINVVGAVVGVSAGLALCWAQQQFGLVSMEGAMVDYYPIMINWVDVIGIFLTVVIVGAIFSFGLVGRLMNRFAWRAP